MTMLAVNVGDAVSALAMAERGEDWENDGPTGKQADIPVMPISSFEPDFDLGCALGFRT
jgi:hypothetical protein